MEIPVLGKSTKIIKNIALNKLRGVLKTIWQWLLNDNRQKIPRVPNECLIMVQCWRAFKFQNEPQRVLGNQFLQIFLAFYPKRYLIWCYVKSCVNWITWKKQGTPYTWSKKWHSEQQNPVLGILTNTNAKILFDGLLQWNEYFFLQKF